MPVYTSNSNGNHSKRDPPSLSLSVDEIVEYFQQHNVLDDDLSSSPSSPSSSYSDSASYAGDDSDSCFEVKLCVDGRAKPNPGTTGSWGAFSFVMSSGKAYEPVTDMLEARGKLGIVTNNQAEYLSLIHGWELVGRQLDILCIPRGLARVRVYTCSELLAFQMAGTYAVENPTLQAFYKIAATYASEFARVSYVAVRGDSDDVLAQLLGHVSDLSHFALHREHFSLLRNTVVWRPALTNLVRVHAFGLRTVASHDVASVGAGDHCLVDLSFLHSVKGRKTRFCYIPDPEPLFHVQSAFPLSAVQGNGSLVMTVVGTICMKLTTMWPKKRDNPDSFQSITNWVHALVVHGLPVPIHVAVKDDGRSQEEDRNRDYGLGSGSFVPKKLMLRAGHVIPFAMEGLPRGTWKEHAFWTRGRSDVKEEDVGETSD